MKNCKHNYQQESQSDTFRQLLKLKERKSQLDYALEAEFMKGKKGKVVLGPSDTRYFSVHVAFPAHSALLSLSGKVPCFGIVSKVITSCFMMMVMMM